MTTDAKRADSVSSSLDPVRPVGRSALASVGPRALVPAAVRALVLAAAVSVLAPLVGVPAFSGPLGAQEAAGEAAKEPGFPLYEKVLGSYHREVTTDSREAQAYFDQGIQMIYAFTLRTAIRSFEEAQRHDPECAMCWFGEAWARGPYLNGGMRESNAPEAYEAVQRASELAEDEATEVERALIDAMALRYTEEEDPERRPRLDTLYSDAMADVYERFPDDLDVGFLYAESLMLLNPRRGRYRVDDPFVQKIHGVLEEILARDLSHPGACHLYVHATEATERPEKAEACADLLGSSIPGSSHINHMPSHTYNEIGRWNSAVTANIRAWHSDRKAAWDEGISYGATHNLHMLLYAASMAGQGAVARLAAESYADEVEGGVFYEALVLLRFGWFDRILEIEETPERPVQRGLTDFARGYAHLRHDDPHLARAYLERVREAAASAGDSVRFGRNSGERLLGVAANILEGELFRYDGDLDAAIAAFEGAVERHDALAYSEPEVLNFGSRHWLGAALLEAGRPAEAEAVYRASLEKHPNNGWSLYGLEQALRAQGREADADEARAWFEEEWSRRDTLIRASRF